MELTRNNWDFQKSCFYHDRRFDDVLDGESLGGGGLHHNFDNWGSSLS
jgi:hypothetical protein